MAVWVDGWWCDVGDAYTYGDEDNGDTGMATVHPHDEVPFLSESRQYSSRQLLVSLVMSTLMLMARFANTCGDARMMNGPSLY